MIGNQTGKLLDMKMRSSVCRICSRAKSRGDIPRVHRCRKNHTGSAKSMEPDMVVEMVQNAKDQGINIGTIVGDDDTTTIARVRSKVNPKIKKRSDKNHTKKLLGNTLRNLQKEHSSLSKSVVNYLKTNFSYMVAQGKGNTEKIKQNIPALSKHSFGDHSLCGSWCKHIDNPQKKYTSQPY